MEPTAIRIALAFGIVFDKEPTREQNETQISHTCVLAANAGPPPTQANSRGKATKKTKTKATKTRLSYNGPSVTGGKPKHTNASDLIDSKSFFHTLCVMLGRVQKKHLRQTRTFTLSQGQLKKTKKKLVYLRHLLQRLSFRCSLGCHNSWFWSMHVSLTTGASASSGMGKDFPRCMLR